MAQDGLFPEQKDEPSSADEATGAAATFVRLDRYLQRSWRAAEKLLEGEDPDELFALGRAYYAVYNGILLAAIALQIPRDRYREGSRHHSEQDAIFHSKLPELASDLCKVLEPPRKLGEPHARSSSAFALCRELQKYRKRADYLGLESVSPATARRCIGDAKLLVTWVWEKIREHFGLPVSQAGAA